MRVGEDAIRIVANSPSLLAALVRGTEMYSTRFERTGSRLKYACSCPFFLDRLQPCKHLFALLVNQAEKSELVRNATSGRFEADEGVVEASPEEEALWNEDEDEDEDDLVDDEQQVGSARWQSLPDYVPSPSRGRSGDWRDFSARALREVSRRTRKCELLYFLIPALPDEQAMVIVGARPLGSEPHRFNPVGRTDASEFAHALDRELYGLLLGAGPASLSYYRGYGSSTAQLTPYTGPGVLERLARSGRCYVVPRDLRRDRDREWFAFAAGERPGERARARLGYDFAKLLAWPVLTRHAGAPYDLTLTLSDAPKAKKAKRRFDVDVALVSAETRRRLDDVVCVHPDGLVVLGAELCECKPADAAWLTAAMAQRGPLAQVADVDLPEFIETVFGRDGVSKLTLPETFERLASKPPRPVLELESPNGKKVHGEVAFDYDGRHIPAEYTAPLVVLDEGRVGERCHEAEQEAFAQLARLGFSGGMLEQAPRTRGVTIATSLLHAALHELLAAGWLVQVEGKRYRSAGTFDVRVESDIDWLEVSGNASFDGVEVPFPRLLTAIKARRGVVQLGDGSVGLLPEAWMRTWGLLAELSSEKGERFRVSSRQIGLISALAEALPAEGAGARGLRELRQKVAAFETVKAARAPRGFHGQLRPYQELGLGWLRTLGELGFGACLADDMGLGKTIQVLAYLLAAKNERTQRKPALVVVPRSLLANWLDEARRFTPGLVIVQHWGPERRRAKEAFDGVDVVLTTYGTLRLDIALFGNVDFSSVVLDEAQAIKNKQSATAKCTKLLRAERRIAMSGTPIENHLGELWSMFEFLNPGMLQELRGLRKSLESPKPSSEVLQLVKTLVRPFVLRRTKGEVARDLPDRVEQTLYVELEAEERRHYDELLRHYQASIARKVETAGAESVTTHILEALLRLRQAACHPGLIDRTRQKEQSAKVECLVERIRALREEGHRALVFSQFTSLLDIVRQRFEQEQITFEYLDGKTRDRKARVDRFQSDASIDVFLISLKAGGLGLNLTAADYVFILDPWWNPASEAQAIDRAHRIGQARTVIAYRLLAKNTVEERVADLQGQKRDLVASVMGDEQALSRRLSRSDLEALLALTAIPARAVPS